MLVVIWANGVLTFTYPCRTVNLVEDLVYRDATKALNEERTQMFHLFKNHCPLGFEDYNYFQHLLM